MTRLLGVVVAASALKVAALALDTGNERIGAAVLTAGFLFGGLTWVYPASRWFWVGLALLGAIPALILGSWLAALVIVVVVGLAAWLLAGGKLNLSIDPEAIVEVEPTAVGRNAERSVDEFSRNGFEQVAAISFSVGPIDVIESLSLSPDSNSYGVATDAILNVVSLFSDGKSLVTRNSARTPLPDWVLVDSVSGGTVTALVESHERALAAVAQYGHHPIPIAASGLAQLAIDSDRAVIDWLSGRNIRGLETHDRPLWSRADLDERIDQWHGGVAGTDSL